MNKILPVLILLLFTVACGNQKEKSNVPLQSSSEFQTKGYLELPDIPESLTAPEEKADYIVEHYWDKMDFSDLALVNDTAFIEQSFSNYIGVLPYVSEEALRKSLSDFMDRISGNDTVLYRMSDIIDFYLRDPNSPMRNDRLYLLFGESLLNVRNLSNIERDRLEFHMQMAALNLEGTKANNLIFRDDSGRSMNLHNMARKGLLLLFFYDPDCNVCDSYRESLSSDSLINSMLEKNNLTVLALSAAGDEEEWKRKMATMPPSWKNGFMDEKSRDADLYDLRAMPSLYLLSPDNIVLLKDVDLSTLTSYLYTFSSTE